MVVMVIIRVRVSVRRIVHVAVFMVMGARVIMLVSVRVIVPVGMPVIVPVSMSVDGGSHEGNDQLVNEPAFGTGRAQLVGSREHLGQDRARTLLRRVDEGVDAEDVVEVHG